MVEGEDLAGEADVVVRCRGASFELMELGVGTERALTGDQSFCERLLDCGEEDGSDG